jgi:RHS repeat-associated protein
MNYNGRGERVLSAEGNPAPAWPTTSSAWGQAAAAGVRATVYDEQGQVLSTLRGGNPLRFEEIVWIDSTPVARVESSTSAVLTVHAIHTDHLNTPRALVNAQTQGGQAAGTVIWRWRLVNQGPSGSNAFGAMAAEEDPDGNGTTLRFDLRFPGQQYDASTGLHYNYFRDYEAQTGRYVESDPIGLRGGVGTYRYASNAAISRTDPHGLIDNWGWADASCCIRAMSAVFSGRIDGTGEGGVICCNGRKSACPLYYSETPFTRAGALRYGCVIEHEQDHFDEVECDPCKDIERPGRSPQFDPTREECGAHLKGIQCLFRQRESHCGSDAQCQAEMAGYILEWLQVRDGPDQYRCMYHGY